MNKSVSDTKIVNEMRFERKRYLEQLFNAEGNGMIKVVTGMRRCGKSYLLFNLFVECIKKRGVSNEHIIQVNLEDRRNKALRNPDELLNYIDSHIVGEGKYYVLLDEVQLVEEFEDVLNSYLNMPNVEVYVTGSNAKFLSKDVITEFRGRGWEIRVHPLSFAEYYEVVGGEKMEVLETYYKYGGLPATCLLNSAEDKQKYLAEVFETVYLRDVIERNKIKNIEAMRDLVRLLASGIGSPTNIRRMANTFKSVAGIDVCANTIVSFIEYLKDSFLISEALRYDVKGRKYIGTETKYYFEDMGIRNVVLGFRQIEHTHIMENVIYNELRIGGFSVDVGMIEKFKRDAKGVLSRSRLEIDFVVNRHDERVYIQSAFALPTPEKMEQEEASLLQLTDGFRKVIIAGDRYTSGFNESGIQVVGVFDFLLGKIEL